MITLIDIRSYYISGADKSNMGFTLTLVTGTLEFVLLCIIMNESRLTPTNPIVTEDVSPLFSVLYL
jgi:hypothetical protein